MFNDYYNKYFSGDTSYCRYSFYFYRENKNNFYCSSRNTNIYYFNNGFGVGFGVGLGSGAGVGFGFGFGVSVFGAG